MAVTQADVDIAVAKEKAAQERERQARMELDAVKAQLARANDEEIAQRIRIEHLEKNQAPLVA